MSEISGLASALQTYGPWTIVAILTVALGWLFRSYVEVRDRHDGELREIARTTTLLVEKNTEVNTVTRNSVEKVTSALIALERRLEDVERSIEK